MASLLVDKIKKSINEKGMLAPLHSPSHWCGVVPCTPPTIASRMGGMH